jgi:hypothetical protein
MASRFLNSNGCGRKNSARMALKPRFRLFLWGFSSRKNIEEAYPASAIPGTNFADGL